MAFITPSPSEVKGGLFVAFLAAVGIAYDIYRHIAWRSNVPRGETYEAEVVRRPPPQVDTNYVLYERKVYYRRKARPRVVNVNRAGISELVALPGIGPKLARRILDLRKRRGPFRTPEDLLEVKGIGPKKLERIRPYLRF